MEKNHGNENKLNIFIAEFVGTTILSLSLNCAWTSNSIFTTVNGVTVHNPNAYFLYIMTGCCLYACFYILSPISGGHFNPAITIAVYISLAFNSHNLLILLIFITAQLSGAFTGMLLSRGLRV